MVRAYTNLAGLSKALARAGLSGNEARSMAPFCANFTRAHDLFDFVDAGDKKENADFKIRELFRLFVENGACKHIFFAGWYVSLKHGYREPFTYTVHGLSRDTVKTALNKTNMAKCDEVPGVRVDLDPKNVC